MTAIKVCGVRRPEDARRCAELGVDALGLNFWPGTPRAVTVEEGRAALAAWADGGGAVDAVVAVFVDPSEAEVVRVREATGIRWVQLHGAEPPAFLEALLPEAYKAMGIASAADVDAARRYPGEHLLLDARVPGAMPGGTGHAFDWDLATALAGERKLTLAGGLGPANVAEAIARVRPFRVDVASGVESSPGVKDEAALRAFVDAVRRADAGDRAHGAYSGAKT